MGAKVYSQGAEIFAASSKNHFCRPDKKGSGVFLVIIPFVFQCGNINSTIVE